MLLILTGGGKNITALQQQIPSGGLSNLKQPQSAFLYRVRSQNHNVCLHQLYIDLFSRFFQKKPLFETTISSLKLFERRLSLDPRGHAATALLSLVISEFSIHNR